MRYDSNQMWWENNTLYESDRLFEYTNEEIIKKYESDLDKLKNFPCLFTYESQGSNKIKGHIGYISSITKKEFFRIKNLKAIKVTITYLLDKEYPIINIDINNHSTLLALGIESSDRFELNRTHWAVKNRNLFQFMSKYFAKKNKSEPTLQSIEIQNIWGESYRDRTRIFFSHKANHKDKVSDIKKKLEKENFSCFIAHEDIHPTLTWQQEIIKALDTMHVFVGIVTDDFHTGSWTDQEIGYAYKRKIPRLFIKIGKFDPKGFISSEQALNANWGNIHTKIMRHLKKEKEV